MFKNNDLLNVYNDYDSKIFAPSVDPRGADLVFFPKDEYGEPFYVMLEFSEIKFLHRNDKNLFLRRMLRFENKEIEMQVFKQLNINLERETESFTREEIEDMILNPSDEVINTILSITKKGVIDTFLSQLIYLKNTNKYFIASKVEDYIRARQEELSQGIVKTELEGQETENVSVVDAGVETAIVEETPVAEPVEAPKKKGTRKPRTAKK